MRVKILLLLLILTTGCTKKALKLPKSHVKAATEVLNNSSIWIFFSLKDKDTIAMLNRNNSISTTNWLFNIDRRLKLKQLYKPLKKILIKRQKVSPHHVEGLKSYFSFADTLDLRNKFLAFNLTDIQYKKPSLKDSSLLIFEFYKPHFTLNKQAFKYSQFDSIVAINSQKLTKSQFYYDDNLSYNDYLKIKILLHKSPFLKGVQITTDFYFK
jgi:hypothetical protein